MGAAAVAASNSEVVAEHVRRRSASGVVGAAS
jgi:hypothetical protein